MICIVHSLIERIDLKHVLISMNKKLGAFLFLICFSNVAFTQVDSIQILDSISLTKSIDLQGWRGTCAHSHDCCSIRCSCCPQANRDQKYKVLQLKRFHGARRKVVAERFALARLNEASPIRFEFYREDSLFASYFSTKLAYSNSQRDYAFVYDHLDFNDSTELVFDQTGAYYLIDEAGNKLDIDFQHTTSIDESIEQVSIVSNGRRIFGLKNTSGDMLTGLAYSRIEPVSEDYFIASKTPIEGWPWTTHIGSSNIVLNRNGQEVLQSNGAIKHLGKGFFALFENGECQLMHATKGSISHGSYQRLEQVNEGYILFMSEKRYGFIDTLGEVKVKARFEAAESFSEGRAAVKRNGKWGFINKKGEWVIENKYDQVRSFREGLAPVAIGPSWNQRVWGIIDTNGNSLKTEAFDEIRGIKGGLFRVFVNGKGSGFINRKGKEVIPFHYDFLDSGIQESWFSHGKLTARDNSNGRQLVWLNEKGKVLKQFKNVNYILPLYDRESGDRRQLLPYFVFRGESEEALADLSGEMVIPFKRQSFRAWTKTHVLISQEKGYWSYNLVTGKHIFLGPGSLLAVFDDGVIQLKMESGECFALDTEGVRIDTIVEKQ